MAAGLVLCSAPALASPTFVAPRRIDATPVPYPPDGHGDASVALTLVVDAQGAVTDVHVTRGEPPFAGAAAAAVSTWRFEPAMRDDVPIASRIAAMVDFHAPAPAQRAPPAPPARAAPVPAGPTRTSVPYTPAPEVVTVHGEREELDTIHISRTQTRFVPGAFGDPFRVVEALPGMVAQRLAVLLRARVAARECGLRDRRDPRAPALSRGGGAFNDRARARRVRGPVPGRLPGALRSICGGHRRGRDDVARDRSDPGRIRRARLRRQRVRRDAVRRWSRQRDGRGPVRIHQSRHCARGAEVHRGLLGLPGEGLP